SFFLAEPMLRDAMRELLKGAPDMSRALSRIALNRGGPRALGSLTCGLSAAVTAAELLAGKSLPAEVASAFSTLQALPQELSQHLDAALADELPLLKRDGGFVR